MSYAILNFIWLLYGIYDNFSSLKKEFKCEILTNLFLSGIRLLAYNFSFYFLMLMVRTFVEQNYSDKLFSLFNFSFLFNEGIFILLNSIFFLLFPKLVKISKNFSVKDLIIFSKNKNSLMLFSLIFLIGITSILLPYIFKFIPSYESSYTTLMLLLIAQIFIVNNFIYSTYIISIEKEYFLTIIGFILTLLWYLTLYYLSIYIDLSLEIIALTNILIYFLYNLSTAVFLILKSDTKIYFFDVIDFRFLILTTLYIFIIYHELTYLLLLLIVLSILVYWKNINKYYIYYFKSLMKKSTFKIKDE